MFSYSKRARLVSGAAVGLGLLLGTACGGGGGASDSPVRAASAAPAAETPAPTEPATTVAPDTTVPVTAAPTTTAKPAASRSNTPATPAAPASTAATAPPATAAPTTPAPTVPPVTAAAARPNPSTPEVLAAIAQFKTKIPAFSPTEAQARQFGDMVCDQFDAGQSYAQVKAAALAQVAAVPFITVTSADADFILKITVKLFCPAHAPKLP